MCSQLTAYADRWCRSCDGFSAQYPAHGNRSKINHFDAGAELEEIPLSAEESYEVYVTRTVRKDFTEAHGGEYEDAEPQIRALLEDLLLGDPKITRSPVTGHWALSTQSKLHGFCITLAPDASAVTRYQTIHQDRTYAQVKAGIRSRIKAEKTAIRLSRSRAWRWAVRSFRGEFSPQAVEEQLADRDPLAWSLFKLYLDQLSR